MQSVSFDAMGTKVTVVLPSDASVTETRRLFDQVEQVCSRFLKHSELGRLNDSSTSTVEVSPLLADIFTVAQDLRSRTDRLVDPAVGGLVSAWGYDRTFPKIVDLADPPSDVEPNFWWHIDGSTLWKAPGVRFDLGGIAKGWTADVAVERGLATIVNAGGDLRSNHPEADVDIEDPWGTIVARVPLGCRGLATSSVTRRRWKVAGRPAHHLIDPRTGAPAHTPMLGATVVCDSATLAEAGAKAVLLYGEHGLAWADDQDWIDGALAIWNDGSVYATGSLEVMAA